VRETHGVLEPEQFLPAAEGGDLIEELTLNVLRRACRQSGRSWISLKSLPQHLEILVGIRGILHHNRGGSTNAAPVWECGLGMGT